MEDRVGKPISLEDHGGFSLLEVMVALAILGMALVAIFGLFSGGLQAARLVKDYDQALLYAQQKLEELNHSPTLRPKVERGEFEGSHYRWDTEVSPYSGNGWEDKDGSPVKMLQIQVKVSWPSRRGERTLELNTLRIMIVDQEEVDEDATKRVDVEPASRRKKTWIGRMDKI